ncbi:hypothetical protein AQUSIP_02750 [Aquicella siphonis]|uniref:Restriction endonuclease n=1 Tax=Aquicella siphonis TaxID=254247 RepID=A0A5E4PF70_9COXI|nr:Eco29kI family restriction endonuclease [Aquicella siphonis]VVC75001.1 hypothetical protein AQUSIP_02750 [Aquicella siphonis]
MKNVKFDRNEHVYTSEAFVGIVKDAIRFFNGTPVHSLPPPESFLGTGVYAIYYTGSSSPYERFSELNRLSYDYPLYIGKAVPKGWRQSRISHSSLHQSHELYNRLREHGRNIKLVSGFNIDDFKCRFVIFEDAASDMIGSLEAALIKLNKPLWNTVIDGFGNHDPGKGRYEQAKSEWDVIHPGRQWSEKCKGAHKSAHEIFSKIEKYFKNLG